MEALRTLVNRLRGSNTAGSTGALDEAIACPAVLPGVLPRGMRIIGSRCQWPITSALVPPRH